MPTFYLLVSLHHIDMYFLKKKTKNYLVISFKLLLRNGFGDKRCCRQPFSPTLKRCLGCRSLGEKRWSHPLPLAIIPPGAWHRHMPPCLSAPVTPISWSYMPLADTSLGTVLAHGRQLSGPGQLLSSHLPPT